MKRTYLATVALTGLLVGCFGPQTYFSTIFNQMETLYFPQENAQGRLAMNYEVDADIISNNQTSRYQVYFFTTGLKLITSIPTTINSVMTTQTTTSIFDYAANGVFVRRVNMNTPNEITKTFSAISNESMASINQGVDLADQVLSDQLKSVINNQATNLLIGGQPQSQDVKVYELPIANFVDIGQFSSVFGFVADTLTVSVTFTTSTNQAVIALDASGENRTYEASIAFKNPNAIQANQHLLSAAEKLTYSGYVA